MGDNDEKKLKVFLKDNDKHAGTDESDSGYARAWIDEGEDVVPSPQKIWFEIRNSPAVFRDSGTNKTYRTTSQDTGFTDLVLFHSTEKGDGDLYAYWDSDQDAIDHQTFSFIAKSAPPPPPPPPPPPRVTSIELVVVLDHVPVPIVQAIVHTENGDPPNNLPVSFAVLPIIGGGDGGDGGDGKDFMDINPNPAITELPSDKGAAPDPASTVYGVATTFVTPDVGGEVAGLVFAWVGPDKTNIIPVNAIPVPVNFV